MEPKEGWLPLLLWFGMVFCLLAAVFEADWVPENSVAIYAILIGMLLGTLLAKRPLPAVPAWALLFFYGLLVAFVDLANMQPSWSILRQGWQPLRQYWLQSGALFLDRALSWSTAVFNGQRSEETIVFALGLGLLAYFVTAFASWQLFRHYRPLPALLVPGLALAVNAYFSGGQIWWPALYVGQAMLLTAALRIFHLQAHWDQNQVDYSGELKFDLMVSASVIAGSLLFLALALPNLSIRRLVATFQEQPAVQQAETFLERAFAGVEAGGGGQPGGRDGVGGSGTLPRDYLLGNAPELYETVVMTAVVQSEASLAGVHWRALSYDVYTGTGWALSEERQEPVAANQPIDLPPVAATRLVSQTVSWVQDDRLVRYSLGLPQQLDQDVDAVWRGQNDLVRLNGRGSPYTILSQVSQASPQTLRGTTTADVPPALLARYTALPEDIPQRVRDLAQEVAGNLTNPYDQARALEQFLRQYPYSLAVDSPPRSADPVDYFLFELQKGYCDYYASAMVVMARTLGLPARMGIGYLAQTTDAGGVQVIYQINGHSWAEIYFAGFGWVEFEPTAAFITPHAAGSAPLDQAPSQDDRTPEFAETTPPPIPELAQERPFPWWQLLIVSLLSGLVWWRWRRERLPAGEDPVKWSFGRLQHSADKLGLLTSPSQTPHEFLQYFQAKLDSLSGNARFTATIAGMRPHLVRLTRLYVLRTYAGEPEVGRLLAWESWQKLRRPLWLFRLYHRLRQRPD